MAPIVLFGGFLSTPAMYRGMAAELAALTSEPVSIVAAQSHHWAAAITEHGWIRLLRELDLAVRRAAITSTAGQVILVGHSAGGVLARLYLGSRPFRGQPCGGFEFVQQLITLGSPHYNRAGLVYGGKLSQGVDKHCPGAFMAPVVKYSSVAGLAVQGDRGGSLRQRLAYHFYRGIAAQGNVVGDGLVPACAALLAGSQHVQLPGISHYQGFGGPWYGSAEAVARWWNAVAASPPSH